MGTVNSVRLDIELRALRIGDALVYEKIGPLFHRILCKHRETTLLGFIKGITCVVILRSRFPRDSELSHFSDKRCPVQSESGGSAIPPADDPVGFAQGRENVRPICIRERAYVAVRHVFIPKLRQGSL